MRNWGAQQRCARGPRQGLWGQSGAWLRCPRELAGPGPTTRRRAERSSRRGRAGTRRPEICRATNNKQKDRRPRAHQAARSAGQHTRRPECPYRHKQHRRSGGPPPTHTPSSPARRTAHATPATPVGPQHHTAARQPNTPRRHNKAARPHRGRAARPVSVTHRRITTMSGSPRPLSWRTLEMPSLAATSFAVPSMRGSS